LADNSPYYEAGVKICLHQNVCGNASRNWWQQTAFVCK
jgi:hypothetical protein